MTGRVHIRAKHADKVLFEQLTTRYKEYADDSKVRNEKKEKMKARGVRSPDRADALLGAIWASIRGFTGVWTEETEVYTPPGSEDWYHDSWTEGPVSCEI